jgi:hypothetical protein
MASSPLPPLSPDGDIYYPDNTDAGDILYFERSHPDFDHVPVAEWTSRPGGSVARCIVCQQVLAVNVEVLGEIVPAEQLEWVVEVVNGVQDG